MGLYRIRNFFISQVQTYDRIEILLSQLSSNNLFEKVKAKRGLIKIIGVMAEVFQERLIDFLPRILQILIKKLKENDSQLYNALSESVEALVIFVFPEIEVEVACDNIRNILSQFFYLCGTGHSHTQTAAAMCVLKILQAIDPRCLSMLLKETCTNIFKLLRHQSCKTHEILFQAVLSVMFIYEGNPTKLQESIHILLPVIIDNMVHKDSNVRKIVVEVIFTIGQLIPEMISPYRDCLLEKLNTCRYDQVDFDPLGVFYR